jgi:predicted RND superfamily exporter protein
MGGLDRALSRLATIPLERSKWLLTAVFGLLALAALGLSQLNYEDGARTLFSSSNSEYRDYIRHTGNFAQSDTVALLLVTAEAEIRAPSLRRLRDMIGEIQQIDGVEAVYSLFGANMMNPDNGDIGALEPADLAALPSVQPSDQGELTELGSARSLISVDRRRTVMLIAMDDQLSDVDLAAPTLARITRTTERYESGGGLSFELTGMPPIRAEITRRTYQDQIVVNIAGAILGFLISLAIFRSFWIAALNSITPGVALVLALGVFGLFGFEINVMRNAIPILILVLATADCIHMTYEFSRRASDGAKLDDAIGTMMREIGPPCILTSLTTIIAFASLLLSDSFLVQSLSLSGMIAMALALGAVLLVHPLVLVLAWRLPPARKAFQNARNGFLKAIRVRGLAEKTVRHRRPVMGAALILCLMLLTVLLPIKTDFRFFEYLDDGDAAIQTLETAQQISGPMQSIDVSFRIGDGSAAISAATLDDMTLIHERLEAALPQANIVSLETMRRSLEARGEWPSANNINLALLPLPESLADSLVARDESALLVRVMVDDAHSETIRALAQQIGEIAADVDTEILQLESVTGLPVLAAQLSNVMIKQLVISFLVAALACPLLIGLWYRRWRFGVGAILPNVLPIMAVGAWLIWSGANIQFTSALALTLAFGIAVDDTVHVLNRLALQQSGGIAQTGFEAIVSAMAHVAPALIATTAVLCVGILSTFLSSVPTIWFWGQLCIAIFLLALIADIFLLPAIMAALLRRKGAKP